MTSSPGLIIAAPASSSGKTTVTLGLLRHLSRTGVKVASAKVGPDYIDAAYHSAASGRVCLNLDPWAMRQSSRFSTISQLAAESELIICEGVMGLFDGATPSAGSTADIAAETGWPVILVMDVRAQAGSVAATLRGFATHRSDVSVDGVIFNRVGSDHHAAIIREACHNTLPEIPILGWLPRDEELALGTRHLGLIQAAEHAKLDSFLDTAADVMQRHIDIAGLFGIAKPAVISSHIDSPVLLPPIGQRIAVASDAAFAFCYPSVLDGWHASGAEILMFSPLADEAPDPSADSVYLPGGYPELNAGVLAARKNFINGLRKSANEGAFTFGECGGYMTLGQTIIDKESVPHDMTGLLPLVTSFSEPRLHLGYRRIELASAGPLGSVGTSFRGHEFHYSRVVSEGPGAALFACGDASGNRLGFAGLTQGNVAGSFLHLIDRDDRNEPAAKFHLSR